jgi:hypothetical protein
MKKLIQTLSILLFALMSHYEGQAQTTIPVNVQFDTITVCKENLFTATFAGSGSMQIAINYGIDFNGNPFNSCVGNSVNVHPQVLLMIDSSTVPFTGESLDTVNGIWSATFQFSNPDTCVLIYKLFVDCSVIPNTSSTSSTIDLVQSWTDTAGDTFLLNSNNSLSLPVFKPFLIQLNSITSFEAGYLDTIPLQFYYKNTGFSTVDLFFNFLPDTNEYCHQLPQTGLFYQIGVNGTPMPFNILTDVPAQLDRFDTLIITQYVVDTSCVRCNNISCNCSRSAELTWKCNNTLTASGVFCDSCVSVLVADYTITSSEPTTLISYRNLPVGVNFYDNTCMNDTAGVQWEYVVKNVSGEALDSLIIDLSYFEKEQYNYLTLIPASSISYTISCVQCTVDTISELRDTVLCQTIIPNTIKMHRFIVRRFMENDSMVVSFRTFNCAEDDTAHLLNKEKYFNHWGIKASGRSICGDVSGDKAPKKISIYASNSGSDLHQQIVHLPNVTDLNIPAGLIFGDSSLFDIDCKGITANNNLWDLQLFGYNPQQPTTFNGWLRAAIHCEQGLRVSQPDKDVYFLTFINGQLDTISSQYYYSTIPNDQCIAGDYFFYFDLSSPGIFQAIGSGKFMFELQGCCGPGGNPPATDYNVMFHIQPNGLDTCFVLDISDTLHLGPPGCTGSSCDAWIPLSSTGSRIFTHCPGCKAPGIIVDNYKVRRKTLGYQDSNNDAIADSGFVPIVKGSNWYNQFESVLALNQSSNGEIIEDKLWAHFQEGDSTSGGYTYLQMINLPTNIRLSYLQLLRTFEASLDTMKLDLQEITLYIDTAAAGGQCLNCNDFQVPNTYNTMLAIHSSGASLANYVQADTLKNRWLFTFNELEIADSTLTDSIIYSNDTLPFTGFYEGQRYRMEVKYRVCGNFVPDNVLTITQEEVIKRSEIANKMWLCGSNITLDIVDGMYNMINDVVVLNDSGITIDINNTDTTLTLMDSSYTNNYLFYCETYGGLHYFLAQDGRNVAIVDTGLACGHKISVISKPERGGYESIVHNYPYEYRPPTIGPDSVVFQVPAGTFINHVTVHHECLVFDSTKLYSTWRPTNPISFQLADTVGQVTVYNSQLPQGVCIDSNAFPVSPSDTNLYISSGTYLRVLTFYLSPLSCSDTSFVVDTSTSVVYYGNQQQACLALNNCSDLPSIRRRSLYISAIQQFYNTPNLLVQTTADTIDIYKNEFCTEIIFTNPVRKINGIEVYEHAPFLYLIPPADPAFSNWHFNMTTPVNAVLYPINGVIQLDSTFEYNSKIEGELCAMVNSCDSLPEIQIQTGWNCDGFPADANDTSMCGIFTFDYNFTQDSASIYNAGKAPQNTSVDRCDTLISKVDFISPNRGYVYPAFIQLNDTVAGLENIGVWISNSCMRNTPVSDSVLLNYDSLTQTWPITTADLLAINYNNYLSDSAIAAGECLTVKVHFRPGCNFVGNSSNLPDILFYGITFCGDTISDTASYSTPVFISGNQCTNCFTISKTASQNPVPAGDTLTFNIIITSNNGSPQPVWVTEIYPSDFDTINGLYPSVYWIPAQGSDTITVTGYFNTVGPCDDIAHINTVIVYGNQYLDSASVCVEVSNPCIYDSTIVFRNDSSASTYGSAFVNKHIYIAGIFYVDQDVSFDGCIVEAAAGASIQLLGSNQLNAFNTTFSGCDTMWQGMLIRDRGTISFESNVVLRDAQTGIDLGQNGNASINQSLFENNVTGIYNPEVYPSIFGGSLLLNGVTFDMTSSGFRTSYQGQPAHGVIPFAGVFLNDAYLEIGRDDLAMNTFNNMNNGIRAFRSGIGVRNCSFSNIQLTGFYHTGGNENGSAISVQGDLEVSGIPSELKVFPIPGGLNNVISSRTGIYASYTAVGISGCKMDSMRYGIEVNQGSSGIFSSIIANTIKATDYGINLYDNNGGDQIVVEDNLININGYKAGIGIGAAEFVRTPTNTYAINNNTVTIKNAGAGIQGSGITNSLISNNRVTMEKGINTAPITTGINVLGGSDNTISCNTVSGKGYQLNINDTIRYGYRIAQSPNNQIQCNSSDSTGFSFRFEGAGNANSIFKGNHMGNAWCGLFLNSEAIIGQQPVFNPGLVYHGNIWLDSMRYSSGFGAANLNDANQSTLQQSLFTTNNTINYHNPLIPTDTILGPFFVNDQGWFLKQNSGNSFDCLQSQTCNSALSGGDDGEMFRQLVIDDSSVSTVFIEESKEIAKQLVYEDLVNNSVTNNNDYLQFVISNLNSPIGNLNSVNDNLENAYKTDSAAQFIIDSLQGQLKVWSDSLILIDQLLSIQSDSILDTLKSLVINQLRIKRNAIGDQLNQHLTTINSAQTQALQDNSVISANIAPHINEQYINDVYLRYKTQGRSVLLQEYNALLSVAQQCPSSGGEAVFRARELIRLVNDSIEYDDASVCGQMGIYRKKQLAIGKNHSIELLLIPNPAKEQVQLILSGFKPHREIMVAIHDLTGRLLDQKSLTTNLISVVLNTANLSNGVYVVDVTTDMHEEGSTKMIINK